MDGAVMAYTVVEPPIESKGNFTVVEPPTSNRASRTGEIAGKGFLSGMAGTPGSLEDYAITVPKQLIGKGMKFFGMEPQEIPEKGVIPSGQDAYNYMKGILPKDAFERYIQTMSSMGGTGATIGGVVGSLPGALTGGAVGAGIGGLVQTLKEFGVPDEAIQIASYLFPFIHPLVAKGKTMATTGKRATELAEKAVSEGGKQERAPLTAEESTKKMIEGMEIPETQTPVPNVKFPGGPPPPGAASGLSGRANVQMTKEPEAQIPFKSPEQIEAKPFAGRVKPSREMFRARPIQLDAMLSPVGRVVSPSKFYNAYDTAVSLEKNVKSEYEGAKNQNKMLYEIAQNQIKDVKGTYPELLRKLVDTKGIFKTKNPNPAEEMVMNEIDKLTDALERDPNTSVDELMKTANSLSYRVKYDDIKSGPKDILKSVVHDINEAAIQAVESAGKDSSAIKKADAAYGDTMRRFINDEMEPFLSEVVDHEKIAQTAIKDPATLRALNDTIGKTSQGQGNLTRLQRSIVEDRLKKYIEDPSKIGTEEYEADVRNLEPLVGKDKVADIRQRMDDKNYQRKLVEKKSVLEKERITGVAKKARQLEIAKERIPSISKPEKTFIEKPLSEKDISFITGKNEKVVSKFTGKTQKQIEEIINLKDGREGFDSLKNEVAKKPTSQQYFDKLIAKNMHDLLFKGKIEGKITGKDLYNVLNNKENYTKVEAWMGKKEAAELLKNARENQKTELKADTIKKFSGYPLFIKAAHFVGLLT
jgi:hypothetical protein